MVPNAVTRVTRHPALCGRMGFYLCCFCCLILLRGWCTWRWENEHDGSNTACGDVYAFNGASDEVSVLHERYATTVRKAAIIWHVWILCSVSHTIFAIMFIPRQCCCQVRFNLHRYIHQRLCVVSGIRLQAVLPFARAPSLVCSLQKYPRDCVHLSNHTLRATFHIKFRATFHITFRATFHITFRATFHMT